VIDDLLAKGRVTQSH